MASAPLLALLVTGFAMVPTRQQTEESFPDQSEMAGKQSERLPENEPKREREENVVSEDDEKFQEAEYWDRRHVLCQAEALAVMSVAVCASAFEQEMATMEADARCVVDNIIRPYNELRVCLENLSHWYGCFYPNGAVHAAFLRVHSAFFSRCDQRDRERHPEDAPAGAVAVLTLAPVALIPPLVYAVVRQ